MKARIRARVRARPRVRARARPRTLAKRRVLGWTIRARGGELLFVFGVEPDRERVSVDTGV